MSQGQIDNRVLGNNFELDAFVFACSDVVEIYLNNPCLNDIMRTLLSLRIKFSECETFEQKFNLLATLQMDLVGLPDHVF